LSVFWEVRERIGHHVINLSAVDGRLIGDGSVLWISVLFIIFKSFVSDIVCDILT
jgi:hypothetical protein